MGKFAFSLINQWFDFFRPLVHESKENLQKDERRWLIPVAGSLEVALSLQGHCWSPCISLLVTPFIAARHPVTGGD
jgi:hypothetical protein